MLTRVTITGADDNTRISDLLALSAEFPFAEWGILVSMRHESSPRFPSGKWMGEFVDAVLEKDIAVSMHVCGNWVRRMVKGELVWTELPEVRRVARRVQINTHAEEHISTVRGLDWIALHAERQFIVQLDGVNDLFFDAASYRGMNVAGLFDCSHGAGVLPKTWPWVADGRHYGYAGGLGPHNIEAQLKIIGGQRRGPGLPQIPYWVDMEGQVRNEAGDLDLDKVRRVLKIAASFVGGQ